MRQIIEMPVSIGDIVFFRFPYDLGRDDFHVGTVSSIHISINRKGVCKKTFRVSYEYCPGGHKGTYDFSADDIGKYVFFTREEAEAIEVGADDGTHIG